MAVIVTAVKDGSAPAYPAQAGVPPVMTLPAVVFQLIVPSPPEYLQNGYGYSQSG